MKKILDRIFVDGLSGMAQGLFATLIIGTIIQQIGTFAGGNIGDMIYLIGKMAAGLEPGWRESWMPDLWSLYLRQPPV